MPVPGRALACAPTRAHAHVRATRFIWCLCGVILGAIQMIPDFWYERNLMENLKFEVPELADCIE
jgi:hypothetical protein